MLANLLVRPASLLVRHAPVLGLALLAAPVSAQFVLEPPLPVATVGSEFRVLVGDLNEDGRPDLVTSNAFFSTLTQAKLCLGLGAGQFGPPQDFPFQFAYRLIDFNGDGHLDVLARGGGQTLAHAVSVLLGNGLGGFDTSVGISDSSEEQNPMDADVGDFNGDGALDVAIFHGTFAFSPGRIMVVFGNGDGSFEEPVIVVSQVIIPIDASHYEVRVGDTNGDGLDDVVYQRGGIGVGTLNSATLLSQGDGSFVPVTCAGGCSVIKAADFVLADVNGDGRDDAVSYLGVLPAGPAGAFGSGQVFPSAFVPMAVAVGDLDGDGVLDVVLGRNQTDQVNPSGTNGDVLILRGNGDGSFQSPGLVVSHVPQPRSVTVADIDADGRKDIALAENQSVQSTRILLNQTYAPGSPFLDLGGALAGSNGYPIQIASGTLVTGQPFSFRLAGGPPNGAGFHFVGLSRIDAPFKGGVMIPMPNLINGPFTLDVIGGLTLAGSHWPAGGSGLALYAQFWMPQAGGPAGFAASSGVRAQVP